MVICAARQGGIERGSRGEEGKGWVLTDVYAKIVSGLEIKVVCSFKLAANVVSSGIWKFVNYSDGPGPMPIHVL